MNPKHILVPFDTSPESKDAFIEALKIAKKYDSKITVAYFWSNTSGLGGGTLPFRNVVFAKASSYLWGLGKFEKELQKLEVKALKEDVNLIIDIVKCKYVPEGIVRYAKRHNVILIVMGTRAHKGFTRFYVGSVSTDVAKYCHCAIKIIHKKSKK